MKFQRLTQPIATEYEDIFLRPQYAVPDELAKDIDIAIDIWTNGFCDEHGGDLNIEGLPEGMGAAEAMQVVNLYRETLQNMGKSGTD